MNSLGLEKDKKQKITYFKTSEIFSDLKNE